MKNLIIIGTGAFARGRFKSGGTAVAPQCYHESNVIATFQR